MIILNISVIIYISAYAESQYISEYSNFVLSIIFAQVLMPDDSKSLFKVNRQLAAVPRVSALASLALSLGCAYLYALIGSFIYSLRSGLR